MKLSPFGYYVLIKVEEVEQTSKGGIVLTSNNENKREQEGHDKGMVESFGPAAYKGMQGCNSPEEWGVEEGDFVRFRRYDGVMEIDGEGEGITYRLIRDEDIICKIGDE